MLIFVRPSSEVLLTLYTPFRGLNEVPLHRTCRGTRFLNLSLEIGFPLFKG